MPEAATPKITPSRNTRIAGDLGDKLDDILAVLGQTAAEYLDPLVRRQIENDYRANAGAIRAFQDARERARKLRDELPELQNELGEAGA